MHHLEPLLSISIFFFSKLNSSQIMNDNSSFFYMSGAFLNLGMPFNCSGKDNNCSFILSQLLISEQNIANFEFTSEETIMVYGAPIVLFIGTIGNILSIITLYNFLREKTVYKYLFALAIFDLLVLYIGLFEKWLNVVCGCSIKRSEIGCRLFTFCCYVASFTSVWLIVAVTFERYLAICQELKAGLRNGKSSKRTVVILISIVLLAIAFSLHLFWTLGFNKELDPDCRPTSRYFTFLALIWPWIDITLYFFIPCILIVTFNGLILHNLRSREGLITHIGDSECSLTDTCMLQRNYPRKSSNQSVSQSHVRRNTNVLTLMLILISVSFLLTTSPFVCMIILLNTWSGLLTQDNKDIVFALLSITELLMYFNHSLPFYLYCICGEKFRKKLRFICTNSCKPN